MQSLIETLNLAGARAFDFAWPMLWQSSLLIALVFIVDWAFRRRVRAAVRYALWGVVMVKLLLPPSLALPSGLSWWLAQGQVTKTPKNQAAVVVTYGPASAPVVTAGGAGIDVAVSPERVSLSGASLLGAGIVSFGLLMWMVMRWLQVAKVVQRATEPPSWLEELADRDRRALRLSRSPRLRLVEDSVSPAVCGLFRPVVLLPKLIVERLTAGQLRVVLLHELVHLRRRDVWVNCAQALIQAMYWWHPLVWLANVRIRHLREEAVDDAVVSSLKGEAETYAPTLLEVARLALRRPLASLGLVGILESRSFLRQRIERLVVGEPPRIPGLTFASLFCVVTFGALAVPMAPRPQQTSADPAVGARNEEPLINRIFGVDQGIFIEGLKKEAGFHGSQGANATGQALQVFCESAGVRLIPPKAIYMNERAGLLLVRATAHDLELIEEGVKKRSIAAETTVVAKSVGARLKESDLAMTNVPNALFTRIYKVDPNTFSYNLQEALGGNAATDPQVLQQNARKFFADLGVDLEPPKALFFNDRGGGLFVRGSLQDLDTVEIVVQVLNAAPSQINIRATFLDLPEQAISEFATSAGLTSGIGTNTVAILTPGLAAKARKAGEIGAVTSALSVTTLSGRQAQIAVQEMQTIVTKINPAAMTTPGISSTGEGANGLYQTTTFPVGPALDLFPYVGADGLTVQLTSIATITEFLGYERSTRSAEVYVDGKKDTVKLPLPNFRVRSVTNSIVVADGQTVLLGGPVTHDSNVRDRKHMVVLITPTLIDRAGNRVHPDDELEKAPRR